jgi:subtilisin family serine protease
MRIGKPLIVLTLSTGVAGLGGSYASSTPSASGSPASFRPISSPKPAPRTPVAPSIRDEIVVHFSPRADRSDRLAALRPLRATVARSITALDTVVVRLASGADPVAAARQAGHRPGVVAAEPNIVFSPMEVVPTDPYFAEQWALRNTGQLHDIADPPPVSASGAADADLDATDAWATSTGSADTVIAVIDSGVELANPDLASSLWTNPGEVAANGIDDDANGYVDDIEGWDFEADDAVPDDTEGHGTHIAGIIAAGMNGTGIVGICPGCRIMVLKTDLSLGQETQAIAYAIDNGADIVNASYGSPFFSLLELKNFEALVANGILPIVSAGNENGNNDMSLGDANRNGFFDAPVFPASLDVPGLISVAASNDQDEYASATGCAIATGDARVCAFTNRGHDSVDLAAPGTDILSTVVGGYAVEDGTSMAAPYVSGIAGLVKSLHPTYSVIQLRNAVLNGVDHPTAMADGGTATSGRANAALALGASTATRVAVSSGNIATAGTIRGAVSGRLRYPTNINDVYAARLRRGARYGAVLRVPVGKDYDLYVWKPGTHQIWQFEPGCDGFNGCRWLLVSSTRGKSKDEGISFRARKGGTYYLQVTSWYSSGRYRLAVGRLSGAGAVTTG